MVYSEVSNSESESSDKENILCLRTIYKKRVIICCNEYVLCSVLDFSTNAELFKLYDVIELLYPTGTYQEHYC